MKKKREIAIVRVACLVAVFSMLPLELRAQCGESTRRVSFTPGRLSRLDQGERPASLVVADFSGDGVDDVATANENTGDVAILLGDGSGRFVDTHRFAGGSSPTAVASADLNGDGRLDLIVNGRDGSRGLQVFLAQEDGTFGPRMASGPSGVSRVAAGLLNDDGIVDLAVTGEDSSGSYTIVLGGLGDGRFEELQRLSQGNRVSSVSIVDLDADGRLDILSSNLGSSDLSVYRGVGPGLFAQREIYPARDGPCDVLPFDLDGDGRLDLLSANERDGSFSYLRARSTGGFERAELVALPGQARGIAVADLQGDGSLEIVVAGDELWFMAASPNFTKVRSVPLARGTSPVFVDLDRNGLVDVVTASPAFGRDGGVVVQLNRSELTRIADCNENGVDDACEIASTPSLDFDANGILDACEPFRGDVVSDCDESGIDDEIELASGALDDCNGDGVPDECQFDPGEFGAAVAEPIDFGVDVSRRPRLGVADFDLDGRADVIAIPEDGSGVFVLFRDENLTFSPRFLPSENRTFRARTADLNKDGLPDLVTSVFRDLRVFLNTGARDFAEPITHPSDDVADDFLLVDFSGDGLLDVVAIASSGNGSGITWRSGLGGGRLGPVGSLRDRSSPQSLAASDFDGDGLLDLVTTGSNGAVLYRGLGELGFGDPEAFLVPINSRRVSAFDFDEDGATDLLLHQQILWGDGEGGFSYGPTLASTGDLLDVNGDGRPDLVDSYPGLTVSLGVADGLFAPPETFAVETQTVAYVMDDFDDDGDADFIIQGSSPALVRALAPGRFSASRLVFESAVTGRYFVSDLENDGNEVLVGVDESDPFDPAIEIRAWKRGEYVTRQRRSLGDRVRRGPISSDLDGDGFPDLVVELEDFTASFLLSDREGLFRPAINVALGIGDIDWIEGFPHDGGLDIALSTRGRVLVYADLASPMDPFDEPIALEPRGDFQHAVRADFDGDGRDELKGFGRNVLWTIERSDDSFWTIDIEERAEEFPNTTALRAMDVNSDGFLDLVSIDGSLSAAVVALNDGRGRFDPARVFPIPEPPLVMGVADLDSDRIPDLVTGSEFRPGLWWLRGDGAGGFDAPFEFAHNVRAEHLLVGDFDGDRLAELLIKDEILDVPLELQVTTPLRARDCNGDGTPDECQLEDGDLNANGVPDACEPDCNANEIPDDVDIAIGDAPDCNLNGVPDGCDIASKDSTDIDVDGEPDECQPDCNADGRPDSWQVSEGETPDCNANGRPDTCDLSEGFSTDADADGVPDECQIDCDGDQIPDSFQLASGASDCDENGVLDRCQITADPRLDIDGSNVLDTCEPDCDESGVPDGFEISAELVPDCDDSGIPDECEIASGDSEDCDANLIPDHCELGRGRDSDGNGVLDDCEGNPQVLGDCNQDGRLDLSDSVCLLGFLFLGNAERLPCGAGRVADRGNLDLLDWDRSRSLNVADPIAALQHIFLGGPAHPLTPGNGERCRPVFSCPTGPATCDG